MPAPHPRFAAPFAGLSAFPLTPFNNDRVDEHAFAGIVERLAAAGVDSITALGSTGSYAYLDADERERVARLAVAHAGSVPVFVGIGALRTGQVLEHADRARAVGAAGLLLAPMSYQPLTDDDVFELFRTVCDRTDLPVVVYDNPGTTRFSFDLDLYARIAALPGIASIKIPAVPDDPVAAARRVAEIRDATGTEEARTISAELAPLWELYAEFGGSLRVVAAIAERLGIAPPRCLPLPILGLDDAQRARVDAALDRIGSERLGIA